MTATLRHALLSKLPHQARAFIRVTGEDSARFLQGLLTADVGELTQGRATPAALLTVKGKIVSEIWVLADNDDEEPLLAVPRDLGEAVYESLDAHIIMDDVELGQPESWDAIIVWDEGGELAPQALPASAGVVGLGATHPLAGVLLVGERARLEALAGAGGLGLEADAAAFTSARIQQGRPAWGHELRAERFPPEVGYVDAVSYEKGCYLGQEPLSRIHNRGQVNRVMVRVAVRGEGPLPLPLRAEGEDKEVGELTSLAAGQGLAILRRGHARAGTALVGEGVEVEVTSGPLGDDPGGSGRVRTATVSLGGRS